MKKIFIVICIIFALGVSGCTGQKAAEMYETAKFEELQNNQEHAVKLYKEIIKRYPESEYAPKARKRLKELREK
jgi:TolA-binding protein